MKLRRKRECAAAVVRVSNGAVLARRHDGTLHCAHRPFLCLATGEPCEFAEYRE